MRRKFIFLGMLLGTLCALYLFSNKKTNNASDSTSLLIQALPQSVTLKTMIETLSQQINDIIKKELDLDNNYDFDFFLPKQDQRLTLYYINDLHKNGNNILLSALDNINIPDFRTTAVSIESDVEWFGGQFDEKDELIIMINDPNNELSQFNETIKTATHKANEQYRQTYNHDLYNVTKSERYPYVPHIGLGRIRSTSIKSHIKDPSQYPVVFKRIQSHVKRSALECIELTLNENNKKLTFDKISIFDLNKRSYIKEYFIKK